MIEVFGVLANGACKQRQFQRNLRFMNQLFVVSIIGFLAFCLSVLCTRLLIEHADDLRLIDTPNERSSHCTPTPRAGGLAFFVAFSAGTVALWVFHIVQIAWLLPLWTGGSIVTLIGWMDDRHNMSASSRLIVHFTSALLVYTLITRGFETSVNVALVPVQWPGITFIFILLFVSWMINLYNFMDGIDGLAGLNAVTVSICLACVSAWRHELACAALYSVLALSVLGFLFHNWSPARIFMGDSGSTFLGFTFAALALIGKVLGNLGFVPNLILLGCFVADATYTLVIRLLQRKKAHHAHRDFAFQHAVQMGWSHRRVSLFYCAITLFWLFPLSIAALVYERIATTFLVIAYIPLVAMMIFFKAGLEGQFPKLRTASPRSILIRADSIHSESECHQGDESI